MNRAEETAKQIALIRDFSWDLTTTEVQNAIIETLQLYADEQSREQLDKFADFIADNYEPEDADTVTIHDWLFKFNQLKQRC